MLHRGTLRNREVVLASFWQNLADQFYQSFIEAERWKRYLEGIRISFMVTLGALVIGIILGILVAVIRTLHDQKKGSDRSPLLNILNKFCEFYTTVIRGTPMMVQLLIMGFVVFRTSRNLVGVAILSLGLGMDYITVMKDIIIPQAIKNILPALGNELITLFKDTSLVTVIGLTDLTKAAQQIQAKTYQAFMPYNGIAIMYLLVVLVLTRLLAVLENRLRQSDRR